jgi:predicted DNA-binding WGR domain protein
MKMPVYVCKNGHHNKFWSYELDGSDVVVKWGRLGQSGQQKRHKFASVVSAESFAQGKVYEKQKKGYQLSDEESVSQDNKIAQELGTQYKISRMLFVSRDDKKLHEIPQYDSDEYVYVEVLNSWKKDITRLLLSKRDSFEIAGGITEQEGVITFGRITPTSSNFIRAIRNVLKRIASEVVAVIKTIKFGAMGVRSLFDDDEETGESVMDTVYNQVHADCVDQSVVASFAAMGNRVLEL